MSLVRLEDYLRAREVDDGETLEEQLLSNLRMHDQMMACLTFVAEQASRLYPRETHLEPIYGSIELVGEKRAEVAAALSGIGKNRAE